MSSEEEIGDEEKQLKNTSFDLKDYTIIKEGEAEILMHATNQAFYNKTQVNNRDMSIAVLRTFISQHKLEHKAMLARQAKAGPKVPDESVSEMEPPADSSQHNGMSSDGCKLLEEMSQDEQCSISDVQTRNLRRKDLELKPARVLEALSASGLRALRYAREVEGISQVVALDNDKGDSNSVYVVQLELENLIVPCPHSSTKGEKIRGKARSNCSMGLKRL